MVIDLTMSQEYTPCEATPFRLKNNNTNITIDVLPCFQLENKFGQEMEEHRQKLDKEYEALMQNFTKELDRLRVKHGMDLDKKVKLHAF